MKSYLVVGILGIIMVTVGAMPFSPADDPRHPDIIVEWKNYHTKKPIPTRVERDLAFEKMGNEAAYRLDTFRYPESDRKGGEAISEARVYRLPDGSQDWIDFIA